MESPILRKESYMQIAIAVITLVLCAGVLYWFRRSENKKRNRRTEEEEDDVLPRKLPRNS